MMAIPLHVGGTILGRKCFANPKYPCKTSTMQPPTRHRNHWLFHPVLAILIAGLLPCISMQMSFFQLLRNSIEYRLFCYYGFGVVAFLILLIIIGSVAILVAYYMLILEDHRWPWVTFLGSGGTAGYLYLCVAGFYSVRSDMSEPLSWNLYSGYMMLAGFCLFLTFGSVGYLAAHLFLRHIYTHLKRI